MQNLLIDDLPHQVLVDGEAYEISWGFRTSILFELLMQDPEYTDEEKILQTMLLYYQDRMPDDLEKGLNAALDFYRCGSNESNDTKTKSMRSQKPIYSFDQDAPYIYAGFLEQYGVDLNAIDSEDLHWWKFSAMFQSLGENLKISKIMYYRDVDIRGKSKSEKRFLSDMKKRYALKQQATTLQQITLAQRNARMKAYVNGRFLDVGKR